jgi:hypothetical protein
VGMWTLGRSGVRWASNIEVDYEKRELEVRINLMCSGQRLMMVCVLYSLVICRLIMVSVLYSMECILTG